MGEHTLIGNSPTPGGRGETPLLHADEPLWCGAEDDRGLVAPAMRIAVFEFFLMQQMSTRFHRLQHDVVGFPHEHARQWRSPGCRSSGDELAVVADRILVRQAVTLSDHIVVHAMRRCGMHKTGTGFQRDMLAADDGHDAIIEWVLQRQAFQRRTVTGSRKAVAPVVVAAQLIAAQACSRQIECQDQISLLGSDQVILQCRMYAHCLVGRQRPRRGGPDHREHFGAARQRHAECLFYCVFVFHFETDVDGGRNFVLVFDFGFSQGRLAIQTPIHRLATLIQIPAFMDLAERADDVRFGLEIHGQVGTIPIA